MERLAKQLVAHPLYAGRVRLGRCAWECFADATPSIQIDPEDCMAMDTEEHDVAFLASFAVNLYVDGEADAFRGGAHGAGRTNENFRILNAVAMRRAHEEYLIQFINMAAGFG